MADVDDTLPEWSSTTASNKPTGATTIGTGLDDNLREVQGVVTRWLSHKGADIASAGTTDIGAVEGLMHDITGAATVTGMGTIRAGIWKVLKYEGAALLTHNATSLILLGGANRITAAGDVQILMSEGSGNWRELAYMKADGSHLGPVLATEQASTSGTAITFSNIPPWAKKITVMFEGVSTNGTSHLLVRLGDAGGVEDTGYSSSSVSSSNGGSDDVQSTAGFIIYTGSASAVIHGSVVLTLFDSTNFSWVAHGVLGDTGSASAGFTGGSKSLSAALDRISITTVNGTDAFDAGAINILYE